MNTTKHNNKEEHITALIDAHTRGEQFSRTHPEDESFDKVFALISSSRDAITPDAQSLTRLLATLPTDTVAPSPLLGKGKSVRSPYLGTVNWLYERSTAWKLATPLVVVFFAVTVIIGATQKGSDPLSVAPSEITDVALPQMKMQMKSLEQSDVPLATLSLSSESQVVEPAPMNGRAMLMSTMSETTLPSTTPQNVGELIALLSSEADIDVELGFSDSNDPLLSIDQASVDAIEIPYDPQTI